MTQTETLSSRITHRLTLRRFELTTLASALIVALDAVLNSVTIGVGEPMLLIPPLATTAVVTGTLGAMCEINTPSSSRIARYLTTIAFFVCLYGAAVWHGRAAEPDQLAWLGFYGVSAASMRPNKKAVLGAEAVLDRCEGVSNLIHLAIPTDDFPREVFVIEDSLVSQQLLSAVDGEGDKWHPWSFERFRSVPANSTSTTSSRRPSVGGSPSTKRWRHRGGNEYTYKWDSRECVFEGSYFAISADIVFSLPPRSRKDYSPPGTIHTRCPVAGSKRCYRRKFGAR